MKTKFNGILTLFLAFLVQITFAQEKNVSGTASDTSGALPGVSVSIKGGSRGTETDFDGKYTIKTKSGDILVFSYLGYKVTEKTVGRSNTINVTMIEDASVLDEVVVTALGIKRKPKELSYSVQTVKSESLTKTKATNVATAMVGKVSGLQINTISSGVNPSTRVVLRGNRSLLGNNQALIVIDGYPSSNNALDRISPDDIENVTVLKGANASALYGSDAGNGVLVITTKKGKGKLSINYTTTLQLESVAYLPELQEEFGAGGFPDGTLYPLENVNWGPRYDVTKFAVRAYAGQVLARYNQAPLSVLRRLYDNHSTQDSPMALLQLGLALSSAGDSKRSAKALKQALAAINYFGKANIYYSSPVRDLALSAFWLIEQKIELKSWQPLLFSLTKELAQRQWLSTQERNALFLLGKELQKSTGDNMRLAWTINKQGFDEQLKRLQLSLSSEDLLQDITLTNQGSDAVYMNLRASGYERKAPKAMNNGISVRRQYYQLNGKAFNGTEIVSGEKLIVGLTVEADSHLRHALLVDLLPAGLEIENQNLADAYDQSDLQVNGRSISDLMYNLNIATQEYRDDRFVMAIDLPRARPVEVFYLVRAVSPGTFSVPPTFAEDMYRPQVRHQGNSAGALTVLPR